MSQYLAIAGFYWFFYSKSVQKKKKERGVCRLMGNILAGILIYILALLSNSLLILC